MPWTLVIDDSFSRANTSPGGAGTTTGAGNNWTDVNGGVYNISSDTLECTADSGNDAAQYKRDFLTRPASENQTDQQIIIDTATLPASGWAGAINAACRVQNNGTHDCYFGLIDNLGDADVYAFVGGILTRIAHQSLSLTLSHTYETTFSVVGTNPTTYNFTVTDTTTSTQVASLSGIDSTTGLQTSGMYGININGNNGSATPPVSLARVRTYNNVSSGPAFSLSPSSGTINQAVTVSATGTNTSWVNGTTTFSVSGGNGASISGLTVNSSTSATFTLHTGTASGTLTISDNTDSATATFSVQNILAVNDTNWLFSPYNWYVNGSSSAQTNNPGAYFKIGFTGTSCQLLVNTSGLAGAGTPTNEYPILQYSVDDAPWTAVQLSTSTTAFTVSGLAAGTHQLVCYVKYCQDSIDRWTTPVSVVQIIGLVLNAGAVSAAPTLQSKRMLVYGDSITEGQYANGSDASLATGNDSSVTYAIAVAQAFGAEVGVVGFARQGWGIGGNGNVPVLPSSWDFYWSGQSRLTAGKLTPTPDYVLVNEGTNDALNSIADSTVTSAVASFQTALVAAVGANTQVFFLVPFGQYKASAVTAGVTTGNQVHLLNLGATAAVGLTNTGASTQAVDGLHPNTTAHGRLGASVAEAMQAALGGSPPTGSGALAAVVRLGPLGC